MYSFYNIKSLYYEFKLNKQSDSTWRKPREKREARLPFCAVCPQYVMATNKLIKKVTNPPNNHSSQYHQFSEVNKHFFHPQLQLIMIE